MYLLDTNIVAVEAPAKRRIIGSEAFAAWVRRHSDDLYLSTVTVAAIEAGIARADRIGSTTKAVQLRRWLAAVAHSRRSYNGSIITPGNMATISVGCLAATLQQ